MNFFKKNKIAIISIAIIIIFVVLLLIGIHHYFGDYFKYSEWLELIVTSIISVLGILGTLITILISINLINNENKKNSLKKRRIAIVLELEIKDFLFSFWTEFYNFIELWMPYEFEDNKRPSFSPQRLKKISEDFKEMLYELITIDEGQECLEILRFYKTYIECMNSIEKIDFKELKLENTYYSLNTVLKIFETCFNEEYVKYSKMLSYRMVGRGYRHITMNPEEKVEAKDFFYKMNNLIIKYRNTNTKELSSDEYNKNFKNIFNYLDSLK
ncbi:hypothetical protein P7A62_02415 [Clostridium perfringens]|nr:hypothetical protein [Clostridium perfringens]MDK0984575.1 hypothetical protein [Clostridium perfringens]